MVLVDVDILATEDDWQVNHIAGVSYALENSLSNASWQYKRDGTTYANFTGSRVFYLFRGITIPQGSTIDDATLTIPAVERSGLDVPFTIRAVNNSAPTDAVSYGGQTGTGPAFYTPVLTPVNTFTANTGIATDYPVDVKAHVQALVNSFDYSNDNMLFRMAKKINTTTTNAFSAQNFEYQVNPPSTVANLTINYTGATPALTECTADFCEDFSTYAVSKLPTSRDNFNYSTQTIADLSWVTTDTVKMRVDPVNEKIEIDAHMDGTDDHVTFDLGFIASDRWVLRGRITLVSLPGVAGAGSGIYFGLSSNKDDSSAVIQDNAYMGYLHASTIQQWGVEWGVTGLPTDFFSVPIVEALPLGVELYWELKREGNTITGQIFNNSDFTDSRGKPTRSTFNGTGFPKNLRFIKFYNRFVLSSANRVTWEADDIEFWDEGLTPGFFDDFSTYTDQVEADASWVSSDTALIRVDVVNDELDFNWTNHFVSDIIHHDLLNDGITVDEDNWVLRCKATFSTVGLNTINGYCIGLYNDTGDSNVIQDWVHIFMSNVITLRAGDGVNLLSNALSSGVSMTQPTVGVPVFWELKRIGGSTIRLTQFSDANYSVKIDSSEVKGIPSTLSNLRFIKCLNRNDFPTASESIVGTFDDIEFYNGVSEVPKRLGAQQGDITFQDDFVLKPVTFSDDFAGTDNWTDAGTAIGVNVTTDVIDWNVNDVSINHATAFDLGVNGISNNSWALRAKVTINNVVAGASADTNRLYLGLFDSDQSVNSNTVQDGLFIGFLRGSTANEIGLFHRDGAILDSNSDVVFTTTITATTFFVEVKRTSSTSVSISLFSDATYSTLIETQIATIPAGITGLRFIKAQNRSTLTGDSTLDGTIDDVEFYNGQSTLPDWTGTGTKVVLNTTTEVVDWDALRDGTNHAVSHDLQKSIGINADDDNWTLRFKFLLNTLTSPTTDPNIIYITVSDSDDSVDSATAQDHVAIAFQAETSPNLLKTFIEAGTGSLNVATDVPFTDDLFVVGTPVFVELKRTSATSYEASLYSDSAYKNLIERITSTSVDATVNDLRYIKIQNRLQFATEGLFDGVIDDVEFYNGVAVPQTPFVEVKRFEDTIVEDKGWVTTDATAMAVNLTTQVLDINVLRDATQDAIAIDLGGPVSDTRWGLRFKYDITAINPVNTATKRIVMGLFNTNQVASIASAQDGIMIMFNLATDTTLVLGNGTDNTNPQSAATFTKSFTNVITEVKTFYVEIIRISPLLYSIEVFSDPDYSISREKITVVIPASITGLRFLKFLGDETSGPAAGSFTGTVDDITVWDGRAPKDHKNTWRVLDL